MRMFFRLVKKAVRRLGARRLVLPASAYPDVARLERISLSERPSGEDELFRWRKGLLDAEAELAGYVQGAGAGDARAWAIRADLCARLRKDAEALEHWGRVEALLPDQADMVRLRRVELLLRLGQTQEAKRLLARVDKNEVDKAQVTRLRGRLDKARRRPVNLLVEQALLAREALATGEFEPYLRHSMSAVRIVARRSAPVADKLLPLLEALFRYVNGPTQAESAAEQLAQAAVEVAPAPLVFCCGFGWSGSGAVFDFLKDHEVFDDLASRRELSVLEAREYGVRRVLRAVERGAPTREPLVDLVWGGLLGLPFELGGSVVAPKSSYLECCRCDNDLLCRMVTCGVQLLGAAGSGAPGREGQLDALTGFANALLAPRAGYRAALYGNAVHSYNVELLRLLPGAKAFAVIRDPRDQYVSREYESKRRVGLGPKEFVETRASAFRRFLKSAERYRLEDRIRVVKFEQFVTSAGVREAVLEFSGGDAGSIRRGERRFSAEASAKNVGIWSGCPVQAEAREVASVLGPLYETVPKRLQLKGVEC